MQSLKILKALVKKEFYQIFRDPSSIVIAFILPLISSLIFMYGLNLDTPCVTVGIKNDDANPEISTLIKSFGNSQYVQSIVYDNEKELEDDIALLYRFIHELNSLDKALMLFYLEQKTYKEIADILDISETNVATKIGRVKKVIKQKFLAINK